MGTNTSVKVTGVGLGWSVFFVCEKIHHTYDILSVHSKVEVK